MVEWLPHEDVPGLSSTDTAITEAAQLTDALRHPAPAAPFSTFGDKQIDTLHQLVCIFDSVT